MFKWIVIFLLILPVVHAQDLKVGMQDEPKTLNPFKAGDVWSWNVIDWFYEPLFKREPLTKKIIPWIAEDFPVFEGRTAQVKMRRGINWSDGTPLTAHDVKFTADVFLEFKVPRYYSDWEFIEKVEVIDDYTLRFYLKEECTPIFQTGTLMSLIVSKKEWEPVVEQARKSEEPLKFLLEHQVEKPLSVGPFLFREWIKGSYVKIDARKDYWAKGKIVQNREVGPFYDGILLQALWYNRCCDSCLKEGGN